MSPREKYNNFAQSPLSSRPMAEAEWDWTKSYRKYENVIDDEGSVGKQAEDKERSLHPALACSHDHKNERAIYDLALEEKLGRMEKFQSEGNVFFEEGQFDRAYTKYQSVLVYYEYTFPESDDAANWRRIDQIRFNCNLNIAAAALKMCLYREALQNCYEALKVDPQNVKALYRRAQAYRATDKFDEAKADILAALRLMPHDMQLREEFLLLKSQVSAYHANRKAMAGKMMGQAEVAAAAVSVADHDGAPPPMPNAPLASRSKFDAIRPSARSLLAHVPSEPSATGSATSGWTPAGSVDDMLEPVSFDMEAVAALIARLRAGEALTVKSGHDALLGAPIQPLDVGLEARSVEAHVATGRASSGMSPWVFGDLNQPGAFVRRKARAHNAAGAESGVESSCLCCAPTEPTEQGN
jgi:tetratricopeptide (TPR) repeat protein